MNFKSWSIALVMAALLAPISASALGVSIVGGAGSIVADGQTVTLQLLLENATAENLSGLGISIEGYDEGVLGESSDNHLVFDSGQNNTAFSTFYDGSLGGLGGLVSNPVSELGGPFPNSTELNVQAFNAVALAGSNGDGSLDTGVNGFQTIGGADVHITVTFQVNALGATVANPSLIGLNIGTGALGANGAIEAATGNLLTFTGASTTITVVPEPGTALLMGLGLASLASFKRR